LFFIMALWSRSQPFAAFTTALVLYVVINVSSMALNPSGVSGFFLLKILVVIALVRAITSAREITKLKESIGE
jgi:Flp pilus assembly protein TadB